MSREPCSGLDLSCQAGGEHLLELNSPQAWTPTKAKKWESHSCKHRLPVPTMEDTSVHAFPAGRRSSAWSS